MVEIKRSMDTRKASAFSTGSWQRKGRIPKLRAGPGLGRTDRTAPWGGRDS